MKSFFTFLLICVALVSLSGCATWDGLKEDTSKAYDSTKEALHEATE
jgi:hypothetical protein